MPRRVGSPNASVIADTVAVNAPESSWHWASSRPRRYSTYPRSGNSLHIAYRPSPRTEPRCRHRHERADHRGPAPGGGPRAAPLDRRPRHGARRRASATTATSASRSPSPSPAARCATRSRTGSPARSRRSPVSPASTLDFTVMTDQEREDLRDQAARRRPAPPPARARPTATPRAQAIPFAEPGSKTRPLLISSRQGRRRQVERHRQPRRRARPAGLLGRRRRRRHLRLLDPAHARHRPRPGRDRRDARAAGELGRALHLDRLLRARGPGRHLARPDAAQGARAVPHRRVLGRPRLPAHRHAARHRRHRPQPQPVPAPRRGVRRHHAAARRAEGRPRCRRRWPPRSTCP